MQCSTVNFQEGRSDVTLKLYLQDRLIMDGPQIGSPAVIVLPGGGFLGHIDREGEPIALGFSAMGYQTFVLEYSVGTMSRLPNPIIDTALAIAYVRKNAFGFGIDPEQIYVVGFGSGGFLALAMICDWKALPLIQGALTQRPNGVLLVYPMLDIAEILDRLDKYGDPGRQQASMLKSLLVGMSGEIISWSLVERVVAEFCPVAVWEDFEYTMSTPLATKQLAASLELCSVPLSLRHRIHLTRPIDLVLDMDQWITKTKEKGPP